MPGLNDIIGQAALKSLLQSKIQFAKANGVALPHMLISGEAGLGKMTFAAALADEMGVGFDTLIAETLVKTHDLTGVLTNVRPRGIVAIRHLETIRSPVLEVLVEAISTFQMRILIGTGPGARTHQIAIPKFTFIGTTNKLWSVDDRIRQWCTPCAFGPYTPEELEQIVVRIARDKGMRLDADAASDIAMLYKRPGEAEVLLQRMAGHMPSQGVQCVDRAMLRQLREFLGAGDLYPEVLKVAEQLRAMDSLEFEHWVADLFRKAGFQVEVTQASGDHGVDLWASAEGRRVAVQCKRWRGVVGEPVLRDLYGAMIAGEAHSACLITTGSFTAQAIEFSKGRPIHLIELDLLLPAVKSPDSMRRSLLPTL